MDILKRVGQIEALNNLDDVWLEFEKISQELGFAYFIYTISNHNSSAFYYYDNYGLHDKNDDDFYDSFLDFCCASYDTTFTGGEFIDDHKDIGLPEQAYALIKRGGELGMISGIGIPLRLKGSNRYGGFNIGTGLKRHDFLDLVEDKKESLQLACMLVHRHVESLLDKQNVLMEQPTPPIEPSAHGKLDELTQRERHILQFLAEGTSRKECASTLSISESTISTHIKNIYRKLGVHNRVEASKVAMYLSN